MGERILSGLNPYTDAADIVAGMDLGGRTAIVTGGASGIGIETVRALAGAGADVTIAARNLAAAEAAAQEIQAQGVRGKVSMGRLDLADLSSIAAFVSAWGDRPLHMLINNAGVMACPLSYTADGFEMQVGANHLGHFALGLGLAPALTRAAEAGRSARLVSLSSSGHRRGGIRWDDLHWRQGEYDKWAAYGQSKTANALFAVGFHRRFADRGVTANAVMPGGILTPLQRHLPREEMVRLGWIDEQGQLISRHFKTPAQGASTSVWAATAPRLEGVGGLYLENLAQAAPDPDPAAGTMGVKDYALDPADADRLWAISEAETGVRA